MEGRPANLPPMAAATAHGGAGSVPPPSVPLGFLAAAGVGGAGFGLAAWFAADRLVGAPTHPGALAAVHVGVLAFLTMAVLGAVHHFAPVVAGRPLRSVLAARLTLAGMVLTAWLLPSGFAHGPEALVAAGGVVGSITVLLAAWNLSGPLSERGRGIPLVGLRLSVAYLVLTVAFGVVYAFDRQAGWFPLLPHRVLAHAHLGLLGWLGLTYVAVTEKLWPMFLLSHRPRARSGAWAVGLLAAGTLVLATGLLFALEPVALMGGTTVAVGLGCHLASLVATIRHRRRPLELLHGHLVASSGFLVAAVGLAAVAGLGDVDPATRSTLVAAEVACLLAWIALAVTGHAHKIVPFIAYTWLRRLGITQGPGGRPLLFGDLFHRGVAQATFTTGTAGWAAVVVGLLVEAPAVVAVGGGALSLTATGVMLNLWTGPRRARRRGLSAPAAPAEAAGRSTPPTLVTTGAAR